MSIPNADDQSDLFSLPDLPDSPSKRRKTHQARSGLLEVHDGKEKIYCELVQGGFELYYVQKTVGTDGFFNELREEIKSNGPFAIEYDFIHVASRRVSKLTNEVLLNPSSPTRKTNIPRQVLIRMVDTSSKTSRKACADAIARFLNDRYWKAQPSPNAGQFLFEQWAHESQHKVPRYVVPIHFDRTIPFPHMSKLSHHIVDQAVVEVITQAYDSTGPTWAEQNPHHSTMFFDPPYPSVAKSELGYVDPLLNLPQSPTGSYKSEK